IDPQGLCLDDKQECALPVLRFNHTGWLHQSFAARNILWQQEEPTEWLIQRPFSGKSFCLIDFGRSKEMDDSNSRAEKQPGGLVAS
ncbi:uncharacterized protein EDB91DRAFT_1057670, partial [Suillus paluster]|uniref:uncharacterized protein n=1 Tax=Suillus paluster TaxID=48578 RepID=UPI001B86E19A